MGNQQDIIFLKIMLLFSGNRTLPSSSHNFEKKRKRNQWGAFGLNDFKTKNILMKERAFKADGFKGEGRREGELYIHIPFK